jgi:transposase-like protein
MEFIYALVDPCTEEIRYVGRTINPLGRIASHRIAAGAMQGKREWTRELRKRGLSPRMITLDCVDAEVAGASEMEWIGRMLRRGKRLFNQPPRWIGTVAELREVAAQCATWAEVARRCGADDATILRWRSYAPDVALRKKPATMPKAGRPRTGTKPQLHAKVPPPALAYIDEIARESGRSRSAVIRAAIARYPDAPVAEAEGRAVHVAVAMTTKEIAALGERPGTRLRAACVEFAKRRARLR